MVAVGIIRAHSGQVVKITVDGTCAAFARLTREHQDHSRELLAAGIRPIDDPTYRDRDDQIQALRLQFPAVSRIR